GPKARGLPGWRDRSPGEYMRASRSAPRDRRDVTRRANPGARARPAEDAVPAATRLGVPSRSPGAQSMTPLRPPTSSGIPWWPIAIVVVIIIALFGAWRAGLFGDNGEIIPSHSGASPGTGAPATAPPGPQADGGEAPTPIPPAPGVPPVDASEAPPAEQEARAAARSGPRYPVPDLDEQARRQAPLPEPGIASDPPLAGALTAFGDRGTLAE